MFLHIGENYYADISDIICIFDVHNSDKVTVENFLHNVEQILYVCEKGKEVSAVVVRGKKGLKVYMTDTAVISVGRRRCESLF